MSNLVTDVAGSPGASVLRVALTLGGIVVTAVVIFGLGVMEGSRVAERVPLIAAPPSALPTEMLKPLPTTAVVPAAALPPDQLTFYDRLSGVAPAAPVPLPAGQPPVPALVPAAPAPQPQTPAPRLTAGTAPPKIASPAATKVAAKTEEPKPADPAARIRKLAGRGLFTVQLAAVSERSAAEAMASRFKDQGFEVITVMTVIKGQVWYRLRVGTFANKQSATQAAGIFRSAYGLNAIAVHN